MKTLKIFLKLCELNLKKLLIYRASFFISLALMGMWVMAYVILIEVIFYHTSTLAGWNKGSVLLVMSFYYFVQNLSDIFFKENFEQFGDNLRRGELDFNIVKPAPLRLLTFFREIRFDHAAGLLITSGLFTYAFKNLPAPISVNHLLLGFIFALVSVVLYFSMLSIISTITFWIQKNDTFSALIFNVTQLSRYPRQIYRQIVGKILTFALPLALLGSLPAEVAVQFENGSLPIIFIGITIGFYFLGRIFWEYGLTKYTSAN
ncbi:MAG: ABC-2 family transporter protein [Patescibacteria group bacterium]